MTGVLVYRYGPENSKGSYYMIRLADTSLVNDPNLTRGMISFIERYEVPNEKVRQVQRLSDTFKGSNDTKFLGSLNEILEAP